MLVITKHKDNTYSISDGITLTNDLTLTLLLAKCLWEFNFERSVVSSALKFMDKTGNDMIVFDPDGHYTLSKIDYSKALT